YKDGTTKVKGIAFAYGQTASKQTNFAVVRRAAVEYLLRGTPPEETIRACKNFHEFLAAYSKGPSILEVKKATCPSDPGEPVPDLVRYYLGKGDHHLYRRNSKTWTRIADSAGFAMANAVPLEWPHDLDYDKYLKMTNMLLEKL